MALPIAVILPLCAFLFGLDVVAQSVVPDAAGWLEKIAQLGVAGAMLYWFAVRLERRLAALERSSDSATRARLLALSVDKDATTPVREEAARMIVEIDQHRPAT